MKLNPLVLVLERLGTQLFSRAVAQRLTVNAAGYYTVVETVEIAADYNDWVKENQNFIINFASVAMLGGTALGGAKMANLGSALVRNPKAWIAGVSAAAVFPAVHAADFSVKQGVEMIEGVAENTFTVSWNKYGSTAIQPYVKVIISSKEEKVYFSSNVDGLAESLTLLPIGGLKFLLDDDDAIARSHFAQSIASEAVGRIASGELSTLRQELQEMSAGRILTSQRSLLEMFDRRFEYLDEDQIASEMQSSLHRVERTTGPMTFETGRTTDGNEYLLISDKLFIINEENQLQFANASEHTLDYNPDAPRANRYAALMLRFIQIVRESDYVPFFIEDEDDGFEITSPLTDGEFSLHLARLKTEANSSVYSYFFVGEEISSFESFAQGAKDLTGGLIDLTSDTLSTDIADLSNESSISEMFSGAVSAVQDFTGFWSTEEEERAPGTVSSGSILGGSVPSAQAASQDEAKEAETFVGNTAVNVLSGRKLAKLLGF